MKRVVLYPFTSDSFPLIQYVSVYQPEYQVAEVISPLGTGLNGKDSAISVHRDNNGIIVEADTDKAVANCDVLLVPYGSRDNPVFAQAFQTMKRVAEMGKEIWCGMQLTQPQYKQLKKLCETHHSKFCYGFYEDFKWKTETYYGSYKPSVPIILVHNLAAEADSFEVTLSLTQRFQKDGYRVTTLGSRPEYNLLGLHGASLFLETFYGKCKLTEIPKLLQLYEQYFRFIEAIDRPDLIIVNLAGAAMPSGGLFPNESGVLTYFFTQAIRPDFSVICTFYNETTPSDFQVISQEMENRFSIGMDCIHMSNKVIHAEQSRQKNKMQTFYLHLSQSIQQAQKLNSHIPAFCALNEQEKDHMYKHILNTLGKEESE